MKRRTALVLGASCPWWTGAARAQPARAARIGLLVPRLQQFRVAEMLDELQRLGWKPRESLEIEQRIGDTPQVLEEHAAALVRLRVDVIVALLSPAVLAARQASSTVPIVIAGAAIDPVASGLATSLAAPGANVTGITVPGTHLASKSLELMRELRASTRRIGVLANGADPFTPSLLETLEGAAHLLDIRLGTRLVRRPDEYAAAFAAWREERTDAVFVQPSLDTDQAAAFALSHRLPSFSFARAFVSSGGLLCYAANSRELSQRAADYVDRILRGADPARLPVEQAKSYDLSLNLRTARALGLSIPNLLMLRATELIG